jgi:hypothetical protein
MALTEISASLELTQGQGIRVFEDKDGHCWFPAKQVIEALGKTWTGVALDTIPDKWKRDVKINTPSASGKTEGNLQKAIIINGAAFQRLLHRSDHPKAIEYCELLAEFEDKVRREVDTPEDLEKLRKGAQLTFTFFTDIKEQRQVNYKWNLTPKGIKNSEWWSKIHEGISGMSPAELRDWLVDTFDIPRPVVENSIIDGLRWQDKTFGKAIACSAASAMAEAGGTIEQILDIISRMDGLDEMGDLIAKTHNTRLEYEGRQRRTQIRALRIKAESAAEAYAQKRQISLFDLGS